MQEKSVLFGLDHDGDSPDYNHDDVEKNHLFRLEESGLASLDLPNRGKRLHRVLLVDARTAWN